MVFDIPQKIYSFSGNPNSKHNKICFQKMGKHMVKFIIYENESHYDLRTKKAVKATQHQMTGLENNVIIL